jgi:hypothetical protein
MPFRLSLSLELVASKDDHVFLMSLKLVASKDELVFAVVGIVSKTTTPFSCRWNWLHLQPLHSLCLILSSLCASVRCLASKSGWHGASLLYLFLLNVELVCTICTPRPSKVNKVKQINRHCILYTCTGTVLCTVIRYVCTGRSQWINIQKLIVLIFAGFLIRWFW